METPYEIPLIRTNKQNTVESMNNTIENNKNYFLRYKSQSMKYKTIPEDDTIAYIPPVKSSLKRQSASFNLFIKKT